MPRRTRSGATLPSALLLALAVAAPAEAQAPAAARPAFDLSVANVMRGEGLVGRSPSEVRWSPDSRWVYFRWRQPESRDTATSVYRVAAAGGAPQRLDDTLADRVAPTQGGSWSADRRFRAMERNGDVYVAGVDGRERRVTATPVRERGPHLSSDGRTVYFISGSNVFAVDLEGGGPLRQLTDVRAEAEPSRRPAEGQRGYLEARQSELLDVVRGRVAERRRREALDSIRAVARPLYIGRDATVTTAEVSPSGRYLLLGVSDRVASERQTLVPNFVTESGYTEPLNVRAKVGDAQEGQRMAIVELATGKATWLQPDPKERRVTLTSARWAPREDRALLVGLPADYKDRWIYVAGVDGRLAPVDHLRDTAWVGGPGLFTAGWLPDGRIYFVSERTGYAHLYAVPASGGTATALTSGEWEVTDVQLSADGRTFYLTTSETHPGERDLYLLPAEGGRRLRVTGMEGWNEGTVSPDGRWAAVLHSTANRPPELYLAPARPGARARRVTESTTAEFLAGPWIRPEVVTIPARDGRQVYARVFRPRELGARPNGALVLFVHGAGYLQNAHRGWSTYFREYMFNHLLAARGYTVLDVDYRGSAGYGAAWRTGIYRHMGGKDLTDHVDAARWAVANEGVDPKRVGIYGGSYGGFITLMGLFTEPDVFRSGAALRSVTDWAHYNHPYTARILNQPQDDPEAYRRSSPIYFAEGLRGDLLMAHGMVDVNVHFQDVVRLSQRLIELGKTNWELAVYPVEDHAFVRADSWTDEYRRILELFERTLR
ncbi:MAG TPA: prolyl oligopeptidase family serine peptidase [Longimicrobiaceae bacterium]